MDRTDSHHLGQHRQSHPRGTTLTCSPCHTPTLRSPWHSASNRQGQTAKTRFAGERIGAAAATIPPASCTTNLSAIHQITSHPWSYRHTKRTPPQTCTFGDMTMTEHTDSSPWMTPRMHTCCYTHCRDPHYGATMSCSLDPRPVFGDAMVSVSRILLLCPTMHYVDDYGSTEITRHSASGFQAFEDFNGALGYRMKPSKRQPPAQTHKIQGVNITIEPQHVVLTPCPQRVQRMCQDILTCLKTNHLDPDMARRMAGKCNFLTLRVAGTCNARSGPCIASIGSPEPPLHVPWTLGLFGLRGRSRG